MVIAATCCRADAVGHADQSGRLIARQLQAATCGVMHTFQQIKGAVLALRIAIFAIAMAVRIHLRTRYLAYENSIRSFYS